MKRVPKHLLRRGDTVSVEPDEGRNGSKIKTPILLFCVFYRYDQHTSMLFFRTAFCLRQALKQVRYSSKTNQASKD